MMCLFHCRLLMLRALVIALFHHPSTLPWFVPRYFFFALVRINIRLGSIQVKGQSDLIWILFWPILYLDLSQVFQVFLSPYQIQLCRRDLGPLSRATCIALGEVCSRCLVRTRVSATSG
ncbi:hypothetical protein DFJ58DRAFT_409978 [Suillus subalutaceus]|uniref:uncharacterized protein n=1 Tax=Suillus subalutaceus TaxID=48586 RepID=UPI001B85EE3D|nr:uncharacterized protein DFJ58DRAFT_409978 [Suillus subalutaceus]KAG1873073.1 hypothetical protein DFJ58DRAFT_409978 [Suillus subalutaceus]